MSSELVMYNAQLLMFHAEICAILAAGVYRWQRTGIKDGALSATMVLLSFLLLWSLTGFVSNLFVPENATVLRDTLSLLLLIPLQLVFLRMLFPKKEVSVARG